MRISAFRFVIHFDLFDNGGLKMDRQETDRNTFFAFAILFKRTLKYCTDCAD